MRTADTGLTIPLRWKIEIRGCETIGIDDWDMRIADCRSVGLRIGGLADRELPIYGVVNWRIANCD